MVKWARGEFGKMSKKPVGKVKKIIDDQFVEVEISADMLIDLLEKRPEIVGDNSSGLLKFMKEVVQNKENN